MCKKILAFLTAVSLLVVPTVYGSGQEQASYSKEYEVLQGLNIICGYEEFDFGSTMQRFEFINMIMNFYGETAYSGVKSNDAIKDAHAHGLIWSVEEFKPYQDILYEEAVKIVVCALGYGKMAEMQGGWPMGYITVANRIGILKNVDGVQTMPMSKGNIVNLIYNMLEEPYMEQTLFGDSTSDYEATEGETLLSVYRDIYSIIGRLEGTEYTMVYEKSGLNEDEISLSGKIYEYKKYVPDSYLGSEVEAYIRKTDYKDELLYMTKYDEDDTIVVNTEDFVSVSDDMTSLEYYRDNKKENATIAKSAYVIYNGEFCGDYTVTDFNTGDGYIMLTDSDNDNKYDVIKIMSYKNVYAAMVSEARKTVTGEFDYDGALKILELDEEVNPKIRYLTDGNTPAGFETISPKKILSVATSKSETHPVITVFISDNAIEGRAESRMTEDSITVDGVEYRLSESFMEANQKGEELARLNVLGEDVKLSFDAFGLVAAIEAVGESKGKYAYAAKISTNGLWTPEIKVRVFESDEVWREYILDEKLKWNGESAEAQNVYDSLCATGKFTPQLIRYELNGDMKISRIETGVAAGDSERLVRGEEVSGMYTSTNRSINWNVFFDNSTVVWVIPENTENESGYRIDNHAYFVHLEQHTAVPYNLDEYKFAPVVTVEEGKSYFEGIKDTATMYIYTGSGETIDENGNQLKTVEFVGGSAGKAEYTVSEYCEIPALEKGDAVKIRVNKNSVVTSISRCFAFADRGAEKVPANFYTTELMAGYVKKVDYAKQRFTVECGGEQTLRNDLYSSGTTIIVNRNDSRGIIETCGFPEIEEGDYVVIRAQHSRLYDVYIIKNN